MSSMRNAICMTAALFLGIQCAFSQSPAKRAEQRQPTPEEDIRAIRQMTEEQALKIEALTQEVAKISQKLAEVQQAPAAKPAEDSALPAAPAAVEGTAVAQPSASAATASPNAQPQPTPLTSGSLHIVTKGETLTSIARRAKVTVAELLKLNKIENDRTLQIGQALIMPTPKAQESPAENPPR